MLPPAEVPNPELPPGLQTAIPTSKLKLLDQVRREIRLRHYSLRTEEAYVDWIKRFIHFHKTKAAPHPSGGGEASGWRHPRDMGAAEVRQFLEHLATDRNVAAPTQDQALNALVFLYHGVLKIKLGELGEYLRANKPAHLPVVLARPEAQRLLAALPGTHQLIGQLLYGTGMRLLECLRLRIKDVDFERNQITVRDGKGFKDRVTMLPDKLKGELPSPLPWPHFSVVRIGNRLRGWCWYEDAHRADRRAGWFLTFARSCVTEGASEDLDHCPGVQRGKAHRPLAPQNQSGHGRLFFTGLAERNHRLRQ